MFYFQCPTTDPGAIGDADESRSNSSFESANEGAVMEGPAHKPQATTVSSMCCLLICCHKQLLLKFHVKCGSNRLVGSTFL